MNVPPDSPDQASPGTVAKALGVLDLVAESGRPMRFTELLLIAGLPRATLHRVLQTLVGQGLLSFEGDGQLYRLGPRLMRLAHAAWRHFSLAPIARPHIEALVQKVGETVHLAQLDSSQVLYLDKRSAPHPVATYSQTGKIAPAYCTGVGKALLAFLPDGVRQAALAQQVFLPYTSSTITSAELLERELAQIRARGYAIDNQEHEEGIVCIAVPVRNERGGLPAAISITGSLARIELDGLLGLLPELVASASAIANDALAWQPPDAVP